MNLQYQLQYEMKNLNYRMDHILYQSDIQDYFE